MGSLGKKFEKKQEQNQALDNIQALIKGYNDLLGTTNKIIQGLQNVEVMVEAVAELLGADKVAEKIKEINVTKLEANVAQADINFAESVSNGLLEQLEVLEGTEDSLKQTVVCVSVKDENGELKHPSKVYMEYSRFKDDLKPLMLGKKVGESFESPEKSTFTIIGIYRATEKAVSGAVGKED